MLDAADLIYMRDGAGQALDYIAGLEPDLSFADPRDRFDFLSGKCNYLLETGRADA